MKILYVEDEIAHVVLAQRTLAESIQHKFELIHAETMQDALRLLDVEPDVDLVLSDLRLPDGTGLELLKRVRERASAPAVVLVTGQGDQEVAVAALKAGAADYLVKQSDYLHRLPVVIGNAIAQNRLLREQEALRQAEIRYQSLVEQISAVVFLDKAGEKETALYISPRVEELTGYTPDEWYATPDLWASLIHPEDRERILAADKKSQEGGMRFLEEYRLVKRSGEIVWVKEDTSIIYDKDGEPLYWQGILLDVTREKESLESIRKSEERFRRIFHASPIATCVVRMEDEKFVDANQAYLDLVSKSFGDLETQASVPIGAWEDENARSLFVKQLRESGTVQGIEYEFQNLPAGTKNTVAYYEAIELGGQMCTLAMFYDMTEEKRVQKELQAERDFALQVLTTMGQGLTVTGSDGKFRYVNPAYASMLGYKPDEMLGRSPSDFGSPASQHQMEHERALRRQGITTTYETQLLHKDLREVPALVTGVPRWDEGDITGTIAVVTDLTEHKKTGEALARQVKELTVLHLVAIAGAESESEDEIISTVTKIIGQIYPELCGFLLLNEQGDQLTPHPSFIGANTPGWQTGYPITSGITGQAVLLDKIIRAGDISRENGYIEIASGIQSELCIPIHINGRVIGVLNVESEKPAAFTENDERFLNTVASSVGTALEKLRFFKEEQRRSRELNALYQATKSIAQSLKPEIIAENVITTMDELLGYEFASLYLVDRDDWNLIPMAISRRVQSIEVYEKDMEFLRHQNRVLGQGIIGWVAQHGQPIRTGDVDREPHYLHVLKNIKSELCVPLIARGRVIGVLNVESTQPHAYSEQDESLLTALANSAAISFDNARLYQDALQASERRAVLHRISQDIVRFSRDFEQIYVAIHEAAAQLMSCDVFVISLKDDVKNHNMPVYMVEAGMRLWPESLPTEMGLTAAVINEGKTILLFDEAEIANRDVVHVGSARHVQSLVSVPMRIGSKVIGMISAQSYQPHAYAVEEQALLEMLATHAATALENGRLFESEQKRRQEAENLRQAATAMSSTLDPDQVLVEILKALKQVIYYDHASVFLHEDEWLRLAICQGFPDPGSLIGLRFPANDALFQQIKASLRPIILVDAQKDKRFNGWGETNNIRGWMSVPLIVRGNVIGYITLDNYKMGAYSEEIIPTATAFANQAAVTLENARLFQEQIRRSRIIGALADIANEIATTREVAPVLEQITIRALDMLSANHVAIYLLQDDQITLKIVAAGGIYQRELLGHTIRAGEGITGNIFLGARAEIINDTTQDLRRVTVPGTPEKEEKLESLMSSPLILHGRTIGVINAWRLKENGLFNEAELNFLVGIAHQVSICIESGRLFQETSRQAQEADALAEVGRDISATLQLDVVLERIASYAMDLLHSETSAVYLAEENLLRAIASFGMDAEAIKNEPIRVGAGILGNIALQNMGEIVNNTASDPRAIIVRGTEKNPLEHLMGVPIVLKDKLTGLLAVWRSGAGTEFMTRELDFLTSLSRQAAVAIENARLYNETQRRVKELEIINRVSTSLRLAHSMDAMLLILLDETLGLLDSPHGSVWMYDHTINKLIQKSARGAEAGLRHTSLNPGDGIIGRVFTSGKKHISPDLKSDPLLFELNRESITPNLAGICIPIQSTVGPVGALMIAVEQGRQVLDVINLLTILAEITGNSIHRVELYEQREKQVKRLTSLRDIDAAIASSFDLRLTLNLLMDQTVNHLNVDAVAIQLYKPDIQSITYFASVGFQTATPTRPHLRLSDSLAGQVISRQSILHVTDLQNAPEAKNELILRREGFVTYVGIPLTVKGQIKGVFEVFHRKPLSPSLDWMEFLHTLAGQAAIAVDSSQLFENLQSSNQELRQAYDTTLEGWAQALELRDSETEGHTRRVTELTLLLARFMGISDSELVNIHRGVLLHDIGKMGVPDHILKKTGELNASEWVEMRKHPIYAYNLLSPISYLRRALDIPYCHHEHWDGSGYPRGLKGEQIPLSARIFSVVDIWDALLSDRPYRRAWPRDKVIGYLKDVAGTILDPKIVAIFFEMLEAEESKAG